MDEMTHTIDDQTALRQYVNDGSPEAFEVLVRRHADWVYSAALRQVRDPATAEDVAQAAFILLAKKAASLTKEAHLTGWLFNVVRYEAKFIERSRRRRLAHERAAAKMRSETLGEHERARAWEEISPVLDAAVAKLSQSDRQCILLRFYRRMSFAGVGSAMNTSEEAARKRVTRAIARLRQLLAGRGASASSEDLTALMLGGSMVHAAPAAVAANHAAGSAAVKLAAHAQRVMFYARLKIAAGLIGVICLAAGGVAARSVLFADAAPAQPAPVQPAPAMPAAAAVQPAVAGAPVAAQPAMTTDTFAGRIVDTKGQAVSGATVWAQAPSQNARGNNIYSMGVSAKTAADGTFALTVTQKDLGAQYAPSVQVIVHADGFAWAAGRLAGSRPVDIELPLPTFLRAVFVDPTGAPIPGLAVDVDTIRPSSDRMDCTVRLNGDFSKKLERVTDASGAVQWNDLPRLWWVTLSCSDPRFVMQNNSAAMMLPDALGAPDLTVQLRAASTIKGRITYGPTHEPAAGITVRTFGQAQIENGITIVNATATTDAGGNYALTQLLPATYPIFLDSYDNPAVRHEWSTPGIVGVAVAEGQTVSGQDLVLERGGVISGSVTDAVTGAPLAEAYIEVGNSPGSPGSEYDETDAGGRYMVHVPPGKHSVSLSGGPEHYKIVDADKPHDITVADGQSVSIDFQMARVAAGAAQSGEGKVVFADGSPAPGAYLVYQRSDGGEQFSVTDRQGQFSLASPDTPDEPFTLWATLGLLRSHTVSSKLQGDFTLTLAGDDCAPLSGRVVDAKGNPVEGAEVIARKSPDYFRDAGTRVTGADGSFTFAAIPLDWNYRLQVRADGFRTVYKNSSSSGGAFAPVVIKFRTAAAPAAK